MSKDIDAYIATCEWLITDLNEEAEFFDDLDDPNREMMLPILTTLRGHADVLARLVNHLKATPAPEPATPNQRRYITSLAIDLGVRNDLEDDLHARYGHGLDELTKAQASETIERLQSDLDALTVEGFRKGAAID